MLHYRSLGQGPALIILHGLFGMSNNWLTIAKRLSSSFQVVLPDLRNHGLSPHHASNTILDMVNDLLEIQSALDVPEIILLGHSLGGKVAMEYALTHPHKVSSLVVVDMTSLQVEPHHLNIFDALQGLEVPNIKSRKEAESLLIQSVKELGLTRFLLKNLKRKSSGGFEWAMNISAIREYYLENLSPICLGRTFHKNTLLIHGELSDYIQIEDERAMNAFFPNIKIVAVPDAGHWVHADNTAKFLEEIEIFMN